MEWVENLASALEALMQWEALSADLRYLVKAALMMYDICFLFLVPIIATAMGVSKLIPKWSAWASMRRTTLI